MGSDECSEGAAAAYHCSDDGDYHHCGMVGPQEKVKGCKSWWGCESAAATYPDCPAGVCGGAHSGSVAATQRLKILKDRRKNE